MDVGCAAGEFLYFVKKENPFLNLTGSDIRSDLIKKAKINVPGVSFLKKNVLNKSSYKKYSFDKIFMIGVHPIFDSFEKCFNNLIYWSKKNGEIYICDLFNPFPVDVILRYKLSANYKSKNYETGWNIFSKESVINFLKKNKKVKNVSFKNFYMPFDLYPNKKDCIRSWTFKDLSEKRIMTNGLSIMQSQMLLTIKLN